MDNDKDHPADTEDRTDADRFLKIGEDDGIATWLDFETGALSWTAADPPDEPATTDPAAGGGSPMSDDDEPVNLGVLLGTIRCMLDGRAYHYEQVNAQSLHLYIRGVKGLHSIHLSADDKTCLVRVLGSYGAAVPVDRRVAIAEAVSRANFTLILGNFELDFSDGELRFRISMDIEGGLFTEQVASSMLGCTLHTMDRFADTFMRVAFGDIEPEEALREAA